MNKRPTPLTQLYRIEDVMEIFQVSRTTVYKAVEEGKLKQVNILGGPRITAESVRKLMERAA